MIVVCSKPRAAWQQAFYLCHLYCIFQEYKVRVMNVSFDEYSRFFPLLNKDLLNRYPLKESRLKSAVLRRGAFVFFNLLSRAAFRLGIRSKAITAQSIDWEEQVNLDSTEFVQKARSIRLLLLLGWNYRCFQTFEKHADFIRQTFTPEPAVPGTSR
jgi:hypothetical protein